MSRSKRALPAPAVEPRRGQGFRNLFVRDGRLRGGWMLAASLLAWLIVSLGVRLGLRVGFDALFRAWNLTTENVYRAPAWARTLYVWHGSLISLFDALAVLTLSIFLRRAWLEPDLRSRAMRTSPLQPPPVGAMSSSPEPGNIAGFNHLLSIQFKPALIAWLVGIGLALLSAALFLLTDSLRLDWPLSHPHLSMGLAALALIALAGTVAEEAFTKAVIYDGVCGRWGRVWAIICAIATSFIIGSGWAGGFVGAANALLLGGLCCMVYAKYGLWPSALLRWGFGFANMFLLGFGGGDWAVYRLYGVSEQWLTGGDAGLSCGLWMTAFLFAPIAAALFSRFKRRDAV